MGLFHGRTKASLCTTRPAWCRSARQPFWRPNPECCARRQHPQVKTLHVKPKSLLSYVSCTLCDFLNHFKAPIFAPAIFQAKHEAGEVQERRQCWAPVSWRERCGNFCGWSFGGQPCSQGGAWGGRPDSEGNIFTLSFLCVNPISSGPLSACWVKYILKDWWDYHQLRGLGGKFLDRWFIPFDWLLHNHL